MLKLLRLFRFNKIRKKHNPIMSFTKIIIVAGCILTCSFFIIDSNMMYYLLQSQQKHEIPKSTTHLIKPESSNSNVSVGEQGDPYYGLNMMLLNQMAEGYCKDYLSIAEKTAQMEVIQDEVPKILDVNGDILKLPVTAILGSTIAESNSWNGIPKSLIKIESYGKPSGSLTGEQMRFGAFNHNIYKKANQNDLYKEYWIPASDRPTITTFQITNTYMSFPKEHMFKPNGKKTVLPSKMNGSGYTSGTARGWDETDASYLPDILAYYIHSTLNQAIGYPEKSFTAGGLVILGAINHNSGGGAIVPKMVAGGLNGKSGLSAEQNKVAAAKYLNEMASDIAKASARDTNKLPNLIDASGQTWMSYITGLLISEAGWGMGDYCYESGFTYATNDADRRRGLWFGLTGEWSEGDVSRDKIRAEYNKYKPFKVSGRYVQSTINNYGNKGYLYKEHPDLMIDGTGGQKVPACSCFNMITLKHISCLISGPSIVCKMMKAAGVECTPDQAFGLIVPDVPEGGATEDPNEDKGTPNSAVRTWFIKAATANDKYGYTKRFIKDPDKYFGSVYDDMSAFAKMMLTNWYWYTDPSTGKLNGCDYLWGGRCFYVPDNLQPSQVSYSVPAGDNGNSLYHFKESIVGRKKRYGFDCAGLVRTMTSDILPNGIGTSGRARDCTFRSYGGINKVYQGYYNGKNPLGIGPLFKGAYTFSKKTNMTNFPVELQPFDILGNNGHVYFFICWVDKSSGKMLILEAQTGGVATGFHIRNAQTSMNGLIQFDHNNAYKYIMSDRRCVDPKSNATESSSHTTWNSAKNYLAQNSQNQGSMKNGNTINSSYSGSDKEGMKRLG